MSREAEACQHRLPCGILVQRDVISYCDGKNDLLDLSERIGVPVSDIIDIIDRLIANDLLEKIKE